MVVSFFIFFYLIYFLINGERGIISYFKISNLNQEYKTKLSNLKNKNDYYSDKIQRLQTNTIDLDYLDEIIREKTGFIKNDELLIKFD